MHSGHITSDRAFRRNIPTHQKDSTNPKYMHRHDQPDTTRKEKDPPMTNPYYPNSHVMALSYTANYGSIQANRIALYDDRDFTEEQIKALITNDPDSCDNRIIIATAAQYNTVFRSMISDKKDDQPEKHYKIAIDGPAAAGKTTTAKRLAQMLGYTYIDTGALYRAAAYGLRNNGITAITPDTDILTLQKLLYAMRIELRTNPDGSQTVLLNGEDITGKIRTPEISKLSSDASALPVVRDFLLNVQKNLIKGHDVVMEGRDIGSVIMPDANVKFYLTASVEARAKRRVKDLQAQGLDPTLCDVVKDLNIRDYNDSHRAHAPLVCVPDAHRIDNSDLGIDQTVNAMFQIYKNTRLAESNADGEKTGG